MDKPRKGAEALPGIRERGLHFTPQAELWRGGKTPEKKW